MEVVSSVVGINWKELIYRFSRGKNQLKLSTQHKYMYMYQKKLLKWRILSFSFLMKFGPRPCTIVQGLWPDFGAT